MTRIINGQEYEIEYDSDNEINEIMIDGVKIPLDILSESFLKSLDDLVN